VLLDRLQSGFLLFETPQGLVRAELSLRQRIYLLWTFRHFRQLSIPLLNPRQRTLVNGLFRSNVDVLPHSFDPLLAVGVVENFVPTMVPIDASPRPEPARQEPTQKDKQQERVGALPAEIAPQPNPVSSSSPKLVWPMLNWSRMAATKLATTRLARTVGGLCLCIITVGAWHHLQAVPSLQAHNQTRLQQINAVTVTDSAHSAERAGMAENSVVIAVPAVTAPLTAAPETAVARGSIAAVVPVHTPASNSAPSAASISTPKRAIRLHDTASTRNPPLSDQNRSFIRIQASRPPLRFAYPDYMDVRARGAVCLTADVDSDGAVRNVRFISGKRALAPAAVRAIRQWRYHPYLKDDQPVATETSIVISFFSNDAISLGFPPIIPASR
jgi:TonB family protein